MSIQLLAQRQQASNRSNDVVYNNKRLYVHSEELLKNYPSNFDQHIMPSLTKHFYNEKQLGQADKDSLDRWQNEEKIRKLMDSETGMPVVPKSIQKGGQMKSIREYSCTLARSFLRLLGYNSDLVFATFEFGKDINPFEFLMEGDPDAVFDESYFEKFAKAYPDADPALKNPKTKGDLYKLLHNMVLIFLKEFADPRRPHAHIISMEPSKRTWKGMQIPRAHVIFLFPFDNTFDKKIMYKFMKNIGLKFVPVSDLPIFPFRIILPEYRSYIEEILYILKCNLAHVERLKVGDWRKDLFEAKMPHTQFFPAEIQLGNRHVVREFFDDPTDKTVFRLCYRNIDTAEHFSHPECSSSASSLVTALSEDNHGTENSESGAGIFSSSMDDLAKNALVDAFERKKQTGKDSILWIGENADEKADEDPIDLDWRTPMVPSVRHPLFSSYIEIVDDVPRGETSPRDVPTSKPAPKAIN